MPAPEALGLSSFDGIAARRLATATAARLHPLVTLEDRAPGRGLVRIGNGWTRALYDGDFYVSSPQAERPSVSLVFVESREGNTGAADPADLGGGDTDKHLIYEGLSRVAADAVLAGAKTAAGEDVFFSVWHPELVALRAELGLPRHPAQIVATGTGCIDVARSRVFNVPGVPVYVLAQPDACEGLSGEVRLRPWVRLIPMDPNDLRSALVTLRREVGIERISAIGGRTVATALLDQGLVQDIYLTTTERSAGEPSTPFYIGRRPPVLEPIVVKRCDDPQAPLTFRHLAVTSSRSAPTARR